MWLYYLSMGLTVLANLRYHIFQKSASSKVNPFLTLAVTYAVALTISLILSPLYAKERTLVESFRELNWASIALGFAIVGLEVGFLLAYRSGSCGPSYLQGQFDPDKYRRNYSLYIRTDYG